MSWPDFAAHVARGLLFALALLGAGVVVSDGRLCVAVAQLEPASAVGHKLSDW